MGSGPSIHQPTPPPQPTTKESIDAWVKSMPEVFALQQEFAPKEARQQLELLQEYAGPLMQALQSAQQEVYPQTTALQENLSGIAGRGMEEGVPEWMREEYLSNVRAQLGPQAGSPIGADYASRGLMNLQQDWNKYYQNLGVTMTGRQPLAQPQGPAATSYMGGFTPQGVMGFQQGTYGPYASASRPMIVPGHTPAWLGMAGKGFGGLMGGLGAGMMQRPG